MFENNIETMNAYNMLNCKVKVMVDQDEKNMYYDKLIKKLKNSEKLSQYEEELVFYLTDKMHQSEEINKANVKFNQSTVNNIFGIVVNKIKEFDEERKILELIDISRSKERKFMDKVDRHERIVDEVFESKKIKDIFCESINVSMSMKNYQEDKTGSRLCEDIEETQIILIDNGATKIVEIE